METTKEINFLLTSPRIEIMKAISKGKNTPTSIAKELGYSIAHINQQLKIMEAYEYIRRRKEQEKKTIGKPRTKYEISKKIYLIAKITPQETKITITKPDKINDFINNTLFIIDEKTRYALQKFYFTEEEFIQTMDIIAILKKEGQKKIMENNEIHLLVIAKEVEEIRKNKSKIIIETPDKEKITIVLWSHTKEEIKEGIKRKEQYFIEKVKEAEELWNLTEEKILKELKKEIKRKE